MSSKSPVEKVEDIAARWLLKRDAGQWSASDEQQLQHWLNADTGHWVAFTRLESVWRQADRMRLLSSESVPARGVLAQSAFLTRKMFSSASSDAAVEVQPLAKKFFRLAASVLVFMALSAGVYLWHANGSAYRSAVGGLATVPLEDGSSITLNTDSKVQVKFGAKERRVDLTQGEAFFDVAKDPARPFVVYAKNQRVAVLGTRFSVRIKPDGVQIVVADGQVRVEELSLFARGKSSTQLRQGYRAGIQGEHIAVEKIPVQEIERNLSWRSGYIAMQRMPLGEAVAEFNRYNHRQLSVPDPLIASIRITGNLRWDNLEGFLRLLDEGFDVQAQQRGNQIVLIQQ